MRNPYSTPRPRRTATGVQTPPPRPTRLRAAGPDRRPVLRGGALAFTSSSEGPGGSTLADLARLAGDAHDSSGTALTYQLLRSLLADADRRQALARLASRRPGSVAAERKLVADLRRLLEG